MAAETPPSSPMQDPATWDLVAAGYAQALARHTAYAEEALGLLRPAPAERMLDVGAGTGVLTFAAAPRVKQVTAVDFSPSMVDQIRVRAAREAVDTVDARVMNAQRLELGDASFDLAGSLFAFMFFPDRARAWAELYRVLRPGGRLVVATWSPIERRPLMKIGFDALAEALPDLPRPAKGDLQNVEECEAEMATAGFTRVSARTFSASLGFTSAEQYLEMMLQTATPLVLLRRKLGEAAWAPVAERILRSLRAHIPQGGAELAAEAVLTYGER